MQVEVRSDLESALRLFKRRLGQERLTKDEERHRFFLRPGERKRRKHFLHLRRLRRKQNDQNEFGIKRGRQIP
jgi:small subunit ribosomal protein S21